MLFPNYEIVDLMGETQLTAIYKAYHKKNPECPLILKVLKSIKPAEYTLAQLRMKIERLRVLNDPLLIVPFSVGVTDGLVYIIQGYYDGLTLNQLIEDHAKVTLNNFFSIACKLACALNKVHEAGIIHGNIKPHNIIVNPDNLDIRLVGFISGIDVRDISHFIYDQSFVRETLSYTSPSKPGASTTGWLPLPICIPWVLSSMSF